jgi:hypothetical protein
MKHVAILTAAALASAALVAVAAPEGHDGGAMAQRLKQADTNGDGMISKQEAQALPRLLKHFDEIDTNHDQQLSADELRAFHEKMHGEKGKHRGGMLKKLDTDGDGRISRAEAQAAPRLAEHFDEIDANKDGFITMEEMKAAHAKREGK